MKLRVARKITEFKIRINDGRARTLRVKTSVYQDAVAAIPALFGIWEHPIEVEIWADKLLPHYGRPYFYTLDYDVYGNFRVQQNIERAIERNLKSEGADGQADE